MTGNTNEQYPLEWLLLSCVQDIQLLDHLAFSENSRERQHLAPVTTQHTLSLNM